MHRNGRALVLALALVTLWSAGALAAPDRTIAYQGTLEEDGVVVADATLPMVFRFYASDTAPTPLQVISVPAVAVRAGRFAVEIGPISDAVFDAPTLYLGVEVNGVPLEGRTRIRGVPYAIRGEVIGDFRTDTLLVDGDASVGGDLDVGSLQVNDEVFFGTTTRQMLNLWSTGYGIGVQGSTLYQRSLGGWFQWYMGGSHNNLQGDAGGGMRLMQLSPQGQLWTARGYPIVAPEAVGVVRGTVGHDGTAMQGTGYTVTIATTGGYDIHFSPAFTGRPTVVCAPTHPNEGVNTSGAAHCLVDHPNNVSASTVRVFIADGDNTPRSWAFSFIAVGPR